MVLVKFSGAVMVIQQQFDLLYPRDLLRKLLFFVYIDFQQLFRPSVSDGPGGGVYTPPTDLSEDPVRWPI